MLPWESSRKELVAERSSRAITEAASNVSTVCHPCCSTTTVLSVHRNKKGKGMVNLTRHHRGFFFSLGIHPLCQWESVCLYRSQVVNHPQTPRRKKGCMWFNKTSWGVNLAIEESNCSSLEEWTHHPSPCDASRYTADPDPKGGLLFFLTQMSLERATQLG